MLRNSIKEVWSESTRKIFLVEGKGKVFDTYYLKRNYERAVLHVCNCDYMVSSSVRGKGVATKICEH